MEYGVPTFVFRWPSGEVPDIEEQERSFDELTKKIDRLKVWPIVRWQNKEDGIYVTRFVPKQQTEKSDITINYVLFITTIAMIGLGGFLQATSPVFLSLFYPNGWTIFDIAFVTISFIAAMMGILFTHEMGHYLTAKRLGIEASPPYFIPGLPQLGGTFGAFIQQKSPPMNRKDLFDMGIAGPLAGFIVTFVVLVIGFLMSVPLTAEEAAAIDAAFPGMTGTLAVPLLFQLMELLFIDFIPPGGTLYIHPIAFASWVGMLITALNLFPASQLDGGHALRAIVNSKEHKFIGWAAILIMALMGYFPMALLVLIISSQGAHPGALNDTIPLSKSRVALFIIAMIILILTIPPISLSFF
jgi:membrane-associated protease RseP (regulator of RpoE activity)